MNCRKQFSVIIPTYKRSHDLTRCVRSILQQSLLPKEIIVVDDDGLPDAFLHDIAATIKKCGIYFVYHQKNHEQEPQGSAVSRNIGASLAKEDCVILDDDIELDPDFLMQLCAAWRSEDKTFAGVGGRIVNNRSQGSLERIYNKLFGLDSNVSWDVTPVGFQVWDEALTQATDVHYVHGGLCAYRKDVLNQLPFTQFQRGRAALEDVDFFLRAKQAGYTFEYQPKAKAVHHVSPQGREAAFVAGMKETINRKDIFKRLAPKTPYHYVWFLRSLKGWILRQFLAGHFAKATGMVVGFFKKV